MSISKRGKVLAAFSATLVLTTGAITTAIAAGNDPQVSGVGTEQHVPTHRVLTGGGITYKQAATNTAPSTTRSTTFVNVPLASVRVPIAPGRSGLINVRFTGESRCSESGGAGELNWCELRVIIGGVEGYPQNSANPPSNLAFDSTDNGTEGIGSWESHSTESHRCMANRTTAAISVPVFVQWKVTNLAGDADIPEFWLDDWSLVAERSDTCSG